MPAAIAIPLILGAASAGTAVAAAKIGSNAAKGVAGTQAAAADKALGVQQQTYGQARQDFEPYRQTGVNALSNLGQQAVNPAPTFQARAPMSNPGMPTMGNLGASGGMMPPQPSPMPQAQQAGGMVTMVGPDGARRPVPSSLVQQLAGRGFTVVQ